MFKEINFSSISISIWCTLGVDICRVVPILRTLLILYFVFFFGYPIAKKEACENVRHPDGAATEIDLIILELVAP